MNKKIRVWVLDDGSKWTSDEVAEKVGCAKSTAYNRLCRSSKVKDVFKPFYNHPTLNGKRLYTLDDGSQWNSDMVVAETGCKPSTASTRLSCYTDPKKVLAPPIEERMAVNDSKEVREYVEQRNFFDVLGHWKLLNKAL